MCSPYREVDADYNGPRVIEAVLYKKKWSATIGLLFGRFVKRHFVLDLDRLTFGYYSDESKSGHQEFYNLNVQQCIVGITAFRRKSARSLISL